MKKIVIAAILAVAFSSAHSQRYEADWASIDSRQAPDWFLDAKLGIFIHWGLYSVPAWAPADADIGIYAKYAEWYWWRYTHPNDDAGKLFRDHHNKMYGEDFKYQDFAPMFKAEFFNPQQWAKLFNDAGARYVVLTSKHHEGFALWPSLQSWNWNSVDIGPHRDICGELSEAVKKEGLHMGFYYSLYEWFNPLYHSNLGKYVDDHMIPQLKDLVSRYQPDIVWPDGEWDHPSEKWKSTEFLSWLYNESPVRESVIVNDRWGKETRGKHGSFYTTEYDIAHAEAEIYDRHPWEECRGIGTSFGYNRIETPVHYLTSEALVHMLIDKVSSGGNLLLNVGPTSGGIIPPIQQQRLLDIGNWLKINGEAIYGTRKWANASQNKQTENIYFTTKGADLYVICTKFPEKQLSIAASGKPTEITLLGYNGKIGFQAKGNSITIAPPAITPANNPCDYAWVFKLKNVLKQ